MTENRTSQAVRMLTPWAEKMVRTCLIADSGVDTAKSLTAVAEKYLRMEEALRYYETMAGELNQDHCVAREALAFDPLSL